MRYSTGRWAIFYIVLCSLFVCVNGVQGMNRHFLDDTFKNYFKPFENHKYSAKNGFHTKSRRRHKRIFSLYDDIEEEEEEEPKKYFVSLNLLDKLSRDLAKKIVKNCKDNKYKFDHIIFLLSGGFYVGVTVYKALLKDVNNKIRLYGADVKAYDNDDKPRDKVYVADISHIVGQVKNGDKILVLDDLIDRARTMDVFCSTLRNSLEHLKNITIRTGVLLCKKRKDLPIKPDFCLYSCDPDLWIVFNYERKPEELKSNINNSSTKNNCHSYHDAPIIYPLLVEMMLILAKQQKNMQSVMQSLINGKKEDMMCYSDRRSGFRFSDINYRSRTYPPPDTNFFSIIGTKKRNSQK